MARKPDICYINQYVSGSAAIRIEAQQPAKERAKLPAQKEEEKVTVTIEPAAILCIFAAVMLLVTMLAGYFRFASANEAYMQMDNYVSKLRQENIQLEENYRQSYDLEEIRQQALAMGLVPMSQVDKITVSVQLPVAPEETPDIWEEIRIFLAGLFA